jgi:WD40 repeat protein
LSEVVFAVALDEYRCESLAFSPDATLLAVGGSNGLVGLWRVGSGRPLRHFVHDLLGSAVRAVAFSPDGTLLAAGGGNHLKVRDLGTGRLILKREHPDDLTAVAIDDVNARIATACLDGVLRVWSRRGGLVEERPNACGGGTRALSFGSDGPIATSDDAAQLEVRSADGRWVATVTAAGVRVAELR